MRRPAIKKILSVGIIVGGAGLYLVNASWLASPPSGRPTVIAQRGLHQVYGREELTMIPAPLGASRRPRIRLSTIRCRRSPRLLPWARMLSRST